MKVEAEGWEARAADVAVVALARVVVAVWEWVRLEVATALARMATEEVAVEAQEVVVVAAQATAAVMEAERAKERATAAAARLAAAAMAAAEDAAATVAAMAVTTARVTAVGRSVRRLHRIRDSSIRGGRCEQAYRPAPIRCGIGC